MTIEAVLDRFGHVKQTGRDQWIARGLCHEDRSPSVSIRALPSGATLVHCFAGCSASEIVASLGLTMADLFPPRESRNGPRPPRWHGPTAHEALRGLAGELELVLVVARDVVAQRPVGEEDLARLAIAIGRIATAREIAGG